MYRVTLNSISKSFGKTTVLTDISLDIAPGELFFLLGPSGCGKTTLLRLLAGLEYPDRGSILFDQRDVTRLPPQQRNATMVFQNYALWPHLTVRQNVAYGLASRRVTPVEIASRVAEILDLVRMSDYADRLPSQLSGGQQQRVALARALVVHPQLLLLDEPLSNLDARLRSEMRYELARMHRQMGITTVYVTHDQHEALSLADRIAYMDSHRIIQVGTPRQLYLQPKSLTAAQFLGDANVVSGICHCVENGRVTLRTTIGTLRGVWMDESTSPRASAKAYAVVRPEKISVVKTTKDATFTAKVVRVFYEGASERILLSANGVELQVHRPASNEVTPNDVEITLAVSEEDVLIFA